MTWNIAETLLKSRFHRKFRIGSIEPPSNKSAAVVPGPLMYNFSCQADAVQRCRVRVQKKGGLSGVGRGWLVYCLFTFHIWVWVNTYRYIFSGMNIHKSQLFWGSLATRVLTHPHISPQLRDFTWILLDIQSHSPSWQKNAKKQMEGYLSLALSLRLAFSSAECWTPWDGEGERGLPLAAVPFGLQVGS